MFLPLYNLKHLCLIISIYVMFTLIQTHVTNLLTPCSSSCGAKFVFIASKWWKTGLNELENNDANYCINGISLLGY